VPSATLKARSGKMLLNFSLTDGRIPVGLPDADDAGAFLDRLAREMAWEVKHLQITPELLDRFPALKQIRHDFSPTGTATVSYRFVPDAAGGWVKKWHIVPEGMSGEFVDFRYRIDGITGELDFETTSD